MGLPVIYTRFIGNVQTYADSPRRKSERRFSPPCHKEIEAELNAPETVGKRFLGERFNFDDVRNFKPDATVDGPTELTIGGTRIELIPFYGGETRDAMFIHLPELGVLFAGDFIMPYIGAPFVNEGDFEGLLNAIDVVVQKTPRYILHGHEPLTRNFSSPELLAQLKGNLSWLRNPVLAAVRRGDTRSMIHQANLIPPGLSNGRPDALVRGTPGRLSRSFRKAARDCCLQDSGGW